MTVNLILGGGGFIGRHVGLALAQRGDRVRLVGRNPVCPIANHLTSHLTYEAYDLGTVDWDHLLDGVDVVHHYAWSSIPEVANKDPVRDLQTNVRNTLLLLEAMRRRGQGRLIFLSSGGTVYGRIGELPVTEDYKLEPISLYGVAKATVEQYMNVYRHAYGVDCRIARLSNPFGIGQNLERNQGAASVFMHRALAGEPIRIYGNGEVVRDYVHISDVVCGLLALADRSFRPAASFIYNIASGYGTSLNEIVQALKALLGHEINVEYLEGRPYDVPVSVLNVGRAARELNWTPQLTFYEGLQQTLRDYADGARLISSLLSDVAA
jgi:UDP-glucose 4-epimerase